MQGGSKFSCFVFRELRSCFANARLTDKDESGKSSGKGKFAAGKKRRHERSSCSCREASDANYSRPGGGFCPSPQPE